MRTHCLIHAPHETQNYIYMQKHVSVADTRNPLLSFTRFYRQNNNVDIIIVRILQNGMTSY